ncbi:MAG: hypothetical protein AAF560_27045 [Acidobacteriota bacterium]
MSKASSHGKREAQDWDATWEGNERSQLEASLAATPSQRLEWLEEALELAYASGALPRRPNEQDATWEQEI